MISNNSFATQPVKVLSTLTIRNQRPSTLRAKGIANVSFLIWLITFAVADGAARTFAVLGNTRRMIGLGVGTAMVGLGIPVAVGSGGAVGDAGIVGERNGVTTGSAKRIASPPTHETITAVTKKNTAVLAKGIHWFLARSSTGAPRARAGFAGGGWEDEFRLGGRAKGSGAEGGSSFMVKLTVLQALPKQWAQSARAE